MSDFKNKSNSLHPYHLFIMNNLKPSAVSPDDLIFDELDEANKKNYYNAIEKELA